MGKKVMIFTMIIFLMVIIPFVSSAPPFESTLINDRGIQIEVPILDYHVQGEEFEFHVHAHNSSDGTLLKNDTTECTIHLYNPMGEHLIETFMNWNGNDFDFEYEVEGENFTQLGQYAVLFYCETISGETRGGFFEHNFEVTSTGEILTEATSILYIGFIFILVIFFLTSLFFGVTIPYKNSRGMEGELISVNDLKYVKILSLFAAYGVFIWIANLIISLSSNYLTQTIVLGFFKMVFSISIALFYPALIFTIIFMVIQAAKDFKMKKLLGGGFKA